MTMTIESTARGRLPNLLEGSGPLWLLLLAAFLWGSGNVANKTVLVEMTAWGAVFLRCVVAALVLVPFVLSEARRAGSSLWLRSSLLPSGLFALALVLQQQGYVTATVTNASFLVNAACVLTPLIAFLIFREMPGRSALVAALIMFAGAFVMSGAGASLGRITPGDVLCLFSAVAYAAWAVALGRHAMRYGRPVATTLVHCLVTAAVSMPAAAATWPAGGGLPLGALPEVLYLGAFSTAGAFLLMVMAQSRVSATIASVIVAAESVFGAAGGIILLGERPGPAVLAGAALMITAIMVIGMFPPRGRVHSAGAESREADQPPAPPERTQAPARRRDGSDVVSLMLLGLSRMPPPPSAHRSEKDRRR